MRMLAVVGCGEPSKGDGEGLETRKRDAGVCIDSTEWYCPGTVCSVIMDGMHAYLG